MSRNFKPKGKLAKVISVIAIFAVIIGACAWIAAIAKKDTETIGASAFSRGDLNEKGEYVKSDKAIYTEDGFLCKGLIIEPEFESQVTYDVYYYDKSGTFIEAKKGLSSVYNEDYPLAYKARIVIHPDIPEDVDSDEFKIHFYEIIKYAKHINITVDKNQKYNYEGLMNLYDSSKVIADQTFIIDADVTSWSSKELRELTASTGQVSVTDKIVVDGSFNTFDVYLYLESNESRYGTIGIFGADGKLLYKKGYGRNGYLYENFDPSSVTKPCWVKLTLEIPELDSYEGVHAMVCIPVATDSGAPETPCYIFGYNS